MSSRPCIASPDGWPRSLDAEHHTARQGGTAEARAAWLRATIRCRQEGTAAACAVRATGSVGPQQTTIVVALCGTLARRPAAASPRDWPQANVAACFAAEGRADRRRQGQRRQCTLGAVSKPTSSPRPTTVGALRAGSHFRYREVALEDAGVPRSRPSAMAGLLASRRVSVSKPADLG